EEERRDQRKDLQGERGDQHLAQDAAIFADGAEEPADVEAAGEIPEPGAPRDQDQPAAPDRLEIGAADDPRALRRRIDPQPPLLPTSPSPPRQYSLLLSPALLGLVATRVQRANTGNYLVVDKTGLLLPADSTVDVCEHTMLAVCQICNVSVNELIHFLGLSML